MQTRFHMSNGRVMVEHTDRRVLEAIRKNDRRFKRRRIQSVCQAYPSQIQLGVVYEHDTQPPQQEETTMTTAATETKGRTSICPKHGEFDYCEMREVYQQRDVKDRLEHLRTELRAERISYGELCELQSLAQYIAPDDVELLQAAGVPEGDDDAANCGSCGRDLNKPKVAACKWCEDDDSEASDRGEATARGIDFALTINRYPDGGLNGRPYVTADGGGYVCEGFRSEYSVTRLGQMVSRANSFDKLIAAGNELARAANPHSNYNQTQKVQAINGWLEAQQQGDYAPPTHAALAERQDAR